jgi:hypothetical protein
VRAAGAGFEFRRVDEVTVRGRKAATEIYTLAP